MRLCSLEILCFVVTPLFLPKFRKMLTFEVEGQRTWGELLNCISILTFFS